MAVKKRLKSAQNVALISPKKQVKEMGFSAINVIIVTSYSNHLEDQKD